MALVLVKWAQTDTYVLVTVYGGDEATRLGSLAFPNALWEAVEDRKKLDLYVGHKEESVVVDL